MNKILGLFAVGVCVLVSMQARGAVNYTFGTSGILPVTATTANDANLTASQLSGGSGLSPRASISVNLLNVSKQGLASSLATAVSGNTYLSFSVTPNSGHTMSLGNGGSLQFTLQLSAPGSVGWAIESSVTGYGTASGNILAQGTYSSTSLGQVTFNSFSSTFNNLSSQTTFQIYFWDISGNPSPGIAFSSIGLSGATAVPEPITYAVTLFGLIFVGGGVGRFYLSKTRMNA